MDNEIMVLEGLVGALVKAKDLIDNHSQTEIGILKAKCELEEKAICAAYRSLEDFFTEHWDELKGDRLNGGIWRNDGLCGSPMYFGSRIKLAILYANNFMKVVGVMLDCDGEYALKKRNKINHTPIHPATTPHSVNTIDYWTEEWEALKWDRMKLAELTLLIKKELARLVNNQLERNNRAKKAIDEKMDRVEIVIKF